MRSRRVTAGKSTPPASTATPDFPLPSSRNVTLEVYTLARSPPLSLKFANFHSKWTTFSYSMRRTIISLAKCRVCQVCNYRLSAFADVETHSRTCPENTKTLLCPFCLNIFRAVRVYMNHCWRHQNKSLSVFRMPATLFDFKGEDRAGNQEASSL